MDLKCLKTFCMKNIFQQIQGRTDFQWRATYDKNYHRHHRESTTLALQCFRLNRHVCYSLFCRAFSVLQIYSSVQLCFCDNMAGSKHFAVIMRGKKPTLLVLCNFIEILDCGVMWHHSYVLLNTGFSYVGYMKWILRLFEVTTLSNTATVNYWATVEQRQTTHSDTKQLLCMRACKCMQIFFSIKPAKADNSMTERGVNVSRLIYRTKPQYREHRESCRSLIGTVSPSWIPCVCTYGRNTEWWRSPWYSLVFT